MILSSNELIEEQIKDYICQVILKKQEGRFALDSQYFYLPKKYLCKLYLNKFIKDNRIKDYSLFYKNNNGKIKGAIIAKKLDWDTNHFGFAICRIFDIFGDEKNIHAELLDKFLTNLEKKEIKQILCRVNIENLPVIWSLEKAGFNIMGVKVLMSAEKIQIKNQIALTHIIFRKSKKNDIEVLKGITRESFKYSHFFNDPQFNKVKAKEVYAKWVENAIRNNSQNTFIAEYNNEPAGFISYSLSQICGNAIAVIDIIAILEKVKHKGIGRMLINEMFKMLPLTTKYVFANTMINNTPALSLYLKTGFKINGYLICLHKCL